MSVTLPSYGAGKGLKACPFLTCEPAQSGSGTEARGLPCGLGPPSVRRGHQGMVPTVSIPWSPSVSGGGAGTVRADSVGGALVHVQETLAGVLGGYVCLGKTPIPVNSQNLPPVACPRPFCCGRKPSTCPEGAGDLPRVPRRRCLASLSLRWWGPSWLCSPSPGTCVSPGPVSLPLQAPTSLCRAPSGEGCGVQVRGCMQSMFRGCSLPWRGVLLGSTQFKIIHQVTNSESSRIVFKCPNFRFFSGLCNIRLYDIRAHSPDSPLDRAGSALQCPRRPLGPCSCGCPQPGPLSLKFAAPSICDCPGCPWRWSVSGAWVGDSLWSRPLCDPRQAVCRL